MISHTILQMRGVRSCCSGPCVRVCVNAQLISELFLNNKSPLIAPPSEEGEEPSLSLQQAQILLLSDLCSWIVQH